MFYFTARYATVFAMNDTKFSNIPVKPWRDIDASVLAATKTVPTMLSRQEQLLYHWITANWATGAGAIVELGCYAGGSTARLAEGHRLAGLSSTIHAYDRFGINQHGKDKHLYPAGVEPFEGDDLFPLAKSLLAPWSDRIKLHPGMIEDQKWSGEDIEVLVMDASKSTRTTDRFAEMFFPYLIPGRSLVVQQDYLHWKQPWIAVQMELMADCFTPVGFAPNDTIVFRCDARVGPHILTAGKVSNLSPETMIETLKAARQRLHALELGNKINRLLKAAKANPWIERASDMVSP